MRLGVIAVVVAGCRFDTGANPDSDGGSGLVDADRADGTEELDCRSWTPAPAHFDPCKLAAPTGTLSLDQPGTWIYDTTNGVLIDPAGETSSPANGTSAQPAGPAFRYLSIVRLVVPVGAELRVTGTSPLIVAAWEAIQIDGTIAAGTDTALGIEGPGASNFTCSGAAGAGQTHPGNDPDDGGAGGGGGGFQTVGAAGGDGGGSLPNGGRGGAALIAPPSVIRAGCRGGRGGFGENNVGSPGGVGGFGGGAIQLTALVGIEISGRVDAGGGGGAGGRGNPTVAGGGGGGGGSGGLIGLAAPAIQLAASAAITANGGGGGEGGQPGQVGTVGSAGQPTTGQAPGGSGHTEGGDGGDGGADSGPALIGDIDDSGGGGGGGTGFILIDAEELADDGATLSPAATSL